MLLLGLYYYNSKLKNHHSNHQIRPLDISNTTVRHFKYSLVTPAITQDDYSGGLVHLEVIVLLLYSQSDHGSFYCTRTRLMQLRNYYIPTPLNVKNQRKENYRVQCLAQSARSVCSFVVCSWRHVVPCCYSMLHHLELASVVNSKFGKYFATS
jgi:hypothetical protein